MIRTTRQSSSRNERRAKRVLGSGSLPGLSQNCARRPDWERGWIHGLVTGCISCISRRSAVAMQKSSGYQEGWSGVELLLSELLSTVGYVHGMHYWRRDVTLCKLAPVLSLSVFSRQSDHHTRPDFLSQTLAFTPSVDRNHSNPFPTVLLQLDFIYSQLTTRPSSLLDICSSSSGSRRCLARVLLVLGLLLLRDPPPELRQLGRHGVLLSCQVHAALLQRGDALRHGDLGYHVLGLGGKGYLA